MEVRDLIKSTDQEIKQSGIKSVAELQKLDHNVIRFSDEMTKMNRELKDFLFANLYKHHRVIRMQVKAEGIISDLFSAYEKDPLMLPRHIHAGIEAKGLKRAICDYIAGMTDRFAIDEHQKLFDPVRRP